MTATRRCIIFVHSSLTTINIFPSETCRPVVQQIYASFERAVPTLRNWEVDAYGLTLSSAARNDPIQS